MAKSRTNTIAAMLAASAGMVWSAGVVTAQVSWKSGPADQPTFMARAELSRALDGLKPEAGRKRVLVRLDQIPSDAEKAELAAQGLTLLAYVGDNSFFASISGERLDAARVAGMGRVFGAEEIKSDWKLHPDLSAGIVREWSVVDPGPEPELGEMGEAKINPRVAVYVLLHRDADMNVEAEAIQRAFGATIRSKMVSINGLVVELPWSQVRALAAMDGVQYVEPPLPKFSELNAENRATTGVNTLQEAPYGLNGAGVKVMVYDGGTVRATHQDLVGRVTIGDTDGVSDHATHVMGTVGGTGAASGGAERGMAPGVTFVSYGFEVPGSTSLPTGFLYTIPGDLEADYNAAINTHGAHISNNSIGTNTAPNGFPCEWEGNYGLTDTLIDSIVRGSLGTPFRIVWANGNERQGSARCGSTYRTTAPPACAKNHITVGALNSWESQAAPGGTADSMTTFSSWGPADDGRMKPDISAPGCQASGDETGVRSAGSGSDTSYTSKCGTSMASPTVCGIGALLLQDYRQQFPGEPDFRNSTLKVLLAHTALDLGNVGPDNQFGYGRVRALEAVDFLRTGNFTEEEVGQGGLYLATVVVQAGDPEIRVTIAWDDAPGTPNVDPVLVNNLDLILRSPSGVVHYPWTLSNVNPGAAAERTGPNMVDNIEQVLVENPEVGAWTIEVAGTTVPEGPQIFSLGASPFLVNCSSTGVVALNGEKFPCTATVSIKVADCDLNLDDDAIDTVQVTVASTTEPSGLTLVLTEVAPQASTFVGTIEVRPVPTGAGLQVADGDVLTVTYVDADDGNGGNNVVVTDVATIDCIAPAIADVAISNVRFNAATVTFTTNEPSIGRVVYGSSCGGLDQTLTGPRGTSHSFELTGLQQQNTYFLRVEATDDVGNQATADNSGQCYSFLTPAIPDHFTQLFTTALGTNDLDFLQIEFTPVGSSDFYAACVETITQLPVDPTDHQLLSTGNSSPSATVSLTGGAAVLVHGNSFSTFFVNPNGNLSFDTADSDSTESLLDHFERVRVSVLFDNLNPTAAGASLRFAQLEDRAVITWLDVPKSGASTPNTAQCELFYDGRIRFSYLVVSITDGLVGLSNGNGVPADFIASDLSSYGACGPRPPFVTAVNTQTPVNTPVPVTLSGQDDGLPKPASLSYIVTSLPADGFLNDPVNGSINAVPYPLTGNQVIYTPTPFFQGQVTFQYVADDGGVPPDGGASNPALVTITVGGPQVLAEFLVDDSNPGWATMGQWAFGVPLGQGSRNGDPTSGHTGQHVYGYNLAGDYPNSLSPTQYLTSGAIDCSDATGVRLEFQRWLGVESASFDQANIQVSTDNETWSTVWQHTGGSMNPNSWTLMSYDISEWADNQPTVYLRWGMGTTDTSVVYVGWNIDDIKIWGLVPITPPSCAGDANGDGLVNAADLSVLLSNFGQPAAGPGFGDLNGDGQCNGADLSVLLATFGVPCI